MRISRSLNHCFDQLDFWQRERNNLILDATFDHLSHRDQNFNPVVVCLVITLSLSLSHSRGKFRNSFFLLFFFLFQTFTRQWLVKRLCFGSIKNFITRCTSPQEIATGKSYTRSCKKFTPVSRKVFLFFFFFAGEIRSRSTGWAKLGRVIIFKTIKNFLPAVGCSTKIDRRLFSSSHDAPRVISEFSRWSIKFEPIVDSSTNDNRTFDKFSLNFPYSG